MIASDQPSTYVVGSFERIHVTAEGEAHLSVRIPESAVAGIGDGVLALTSPTGDMPTALVILATPAGGPQSAFLNAAVAAVSFLEVTQRAGLLRQLASHLDAWCRDLADRAAEEHRATQGHPGATLQ